MLSVYAIGWNKVKMTKICVETNLNLYTMKNYSLIGYKSVDSGQHPVVQPVGDKR